MVSDVVKVLARHGCYMLRKHMYSKILPLVWFVTLMICGVTGCRSVDVPGRLEQPVQLASAKDETVLIAAAAEIDRRIAAREEMTGERGLDEYLQLLTNQLLAGMRAPTAIHVTTRSLKSATPDVFLLANGSLYISQGAIALLDNPSQLAALLGREVLHYVNRDELRARRNAVNRRLASGLPGLLLISVTIGLAAVPLERSIDNAISGFSEQLEMQADAALVPLLAASGFQPAEAPAAYRALLAEAAKHGDSSGAKLMDQQLLRQRISGLDDVLRQAASATTAPAAPPASREVWSMQETGVHSRLISAAIARGEYDFASMLLTRLERISRPTGRIAYVRALIAQRSAPGYNGDGPALTQFVAATQFADCPADAYRELGFIYRRRGAQQQSAQAFRAYLAKRPDASDAVFIRSYLEQSR